jgi:endogenous inhibitor of DNA gyrase (YacG/DUF329 family)
VSDKPGETAIGAVTPDGRVVECPRCGAVVQPQPKPWDSGKCQNCGLGYCFDEVLDGNGDEHPELDWEDF